MNRFATCLFLAAALASTATLAQTKTFLKTGEYLTTGQYLVSGNKGFYAVQQDDGNFCVYKGTGPSDNRGGVWCHMKPGPKGSYFAIQQDDGNFCTYRGTPTSNQGGQWCHMKPGAKGPYFLILQDDANLCTYRGTDPGANKGGQWCSMATAVAGPPPLPASAVPGMVTQFAPILRFDSGSQGYSYPMSADDYYKRVIQSNTGISRLENTDWNTLSKGTIPIYYQLKQVGSQYRIRYWIFYGYQAPCLGSQGQHNGDWEDIVVITKEGGSGIAAVQFGQHGGRYMRIAGPRDAPCTPGGIGRCGGKGGFELQGSHPVAYVGRIAHGTFHDASGSDLASVPGGACAYYGDSRDGRGPSFDTSRRLVSLDGNDETWLARDRQGNFPWGPDGVNTHPTTAAAPTEACTGSPTAAVADAGCWKSECLAGDDQASEDCLKECKSGYTNVGLTCNKGTWPWEWSVYGRLTGGNKYGYRYTIPSQDAGLARRRNNDNEWGLP